MKRIFASAAVILAFATASNAQVSATAEAYATIVTPLAIAKNVNMNFGNLAVSGTGGTLILPAEDGTPTRTPSGGVTLGGSSQGTVTAAKFTVTGDGNRTFSISHPSIITLTKQSSTETMTVDISRSTTGIAAGVGTLNSGSLVIFLGGTLNVAANQADGVYENKTSLEMTVNYN